MTKLMWKDLHLLAKPATLYILLLDGFLFAVIFWRNPSSISIGAFVIIIQFALVIARYEEGCNNHKFVGSLPVTRRQVVMAKYVNGIVFTVVGFLLALILALPTSFIRTGYPSGVSSLDLIGTVSGALLILGIFYPIFYKFDRWIPAFTASILLEIVFFSFLLNIWSGAVPGLILAGCFLLYGCSYYISLRIYRKKDF